MNKFEYKLYKVTQLTDFETSQLIRHPICCSPLRGYTLECQDCTGKVKYVNFSVTSVLGTLTTFPDKKTRGTGNDQLFGNLGRRYFSNADLDAEEQEFLAREGWLLIALNNDIVNSDIYILYRDADDQLIHIARFGDFVKGDKGIVIEREPFHFGKYSDALKQTPETPEVQVNNLREQTRSTQTQVVPLTPYGSVNTTIDEKGVISLTVKTSDKEVRLDGLDEKTALQAFKEALQAQLNR